MVGFIVISFSLFAFSLLVKFEDWSTLIFLSLFNKLPWHIAILKVNELEHFYLVKKNTLVTKPSCLLAI